MDGLRRGCLAYALRWAAGAGLLCVTNPAGTACAGDARVVDAAGPSRVVVEVNDANAFEVVQALSSYFKFEFRRSPPTTSTVRFNGRLQGSLQQILERILRDQGFTIVHATEKASGISLVVIFEPKSGAPTAEVGESTTSNPASTDNPNRAQHRQR